MTVTAILRGRDGKEIKRAEIASEFYSPPRVLIDGEDVYFRTSRDSTRDPLVFVLATAVRI